MSKSELKRQCTTNPLEMTATPISDEARIHSEPHGYEVVPYRVAQRLEMACAELTEQNAQLRDAIIPFAKLLQNHNNFDCRRKEVAASKPVFGINDVTIFISDLRKANKVLALPRLRADLGQPEALQGEHTPVEIIG